MKYTVAIDPGLLNWAWIIFDDAGVIVKTKHIKLSNKKGQNKRLNEIYKELSELSLNEGFKIESAVIEKQFMNLMIQINGVLKAACDSLDCETFFFVPSEWKKLITGKGNIAEDELTNFIIDKYPEAIEFDEHRIDCIGIYLAHIENKLNPKIKPKKKKTAKKVELEANVIPKVIKKRSTGSKPG